MGRFLTNSLTLILISLLLCGCGDRTEIRRTLYAFMDTEVSLPGEAIVINNGEVSKTRIKKDSYPLLVSFYGYNDCYECEIAHLSSKLSHFLLSDSLKSFRPIIIFAPEAEELSHTIHDLELAQYPFPVYVTLDNGWTNNCNNDETFQKETYF